MLIRRSSLVRIQAEVGELRQQGCAHARHRYIQRLREGLDPIDRRVLLLYVRLCLSCDVFTDLGLRYCSLVLTVWFGYRPVVDYAYTCVLSAWLGAPYARDSSRGPAPDSRIKRYVSVKAEAGCKCGDRPA